MEGASAAAAEAAVKIATPIVKPRGRPSRSPRAAPVSRSTAKVSVYALTVHSRPLSPAWRSVRITGSAVVTTRLSIVVMKSSVDVIANVQSSFGLIDPPFRSPRDNRPIYVVSSHLQRSEKRESSESLLESLEEPPRPRLVGILQTHRGHDVDEHAVREERGDALGRQPGDALDVGDEVAEPVADDLADLGIVTGRIGLELRLQPRAIGDEISHVDATHRVESVVAALSLGGALERLQRLAHAACDGGLEELLLRPEEPEDVRLRDAGPLCDLLRGRAVQAAGGELHLRRV